MTQAELVEHIHAWKVGCFVAAMFLDAVVFLVWLGGKIALEGITIK